MSVVDDDLAAIYRAVNPFAVLAVFDVNGSDLEVYGTFTEETKSTEILSGQPMTYDNSFTCRTAEIATVKREMTVTINTVVYTVKKIENVGTGTSLVTLKT